ncbi:MAG: hypothetical protein FWG83_04460 [Oscillospiraceae bacterium]|nr:hypothetical protein [Oscillospiraceae bacterium]
MKKRICSVCSMLVAVAIFFSVFPLAESSGQSSVSRMVTINNQLYIGFAEDDSKLVFGFNEDVDMPAQFSVSRANYSYSGFNSELGIPIMNEASVWGYGYRYSMIDSHAGELNFAGDAINFSEGEVVFFMEVEGRGTISLDGVFYVDLKGAGELLKIPFDVTVTNVRDTLPLIKGDVDGNGTVGISDALEILKFLAGMSSVIEKGNPAWDSARITGGEAPVIADVLEILKKLAGMESSLDN